MGKDRKNILNENYKYLRECGLTSKEATKYKYHKPETINRIGRLSMLYKAQLKECQDIIDTFKKEISNIGDSNE